MIPKPIFPYKKDKFSGLSINTNLLMSSVTSESSISNFVAQTPKQNRLTFNPKRNTILDNNEQKQNSTHSNIQFNQQQNFRKNKLPYKMVTSELPAPCINHSEKQSSFYVQLQQNNDPIFYCQKCAILVASQGFKVKKIENNHILAKMENQIYKSSRYATNVLMNDTKTIKKSKINEINSNINKQKQLNKFLNMLQRVQVNLNRNLSQNQVHIERLHKKSQGKIMQIKQGFEKIHTILYQYQQRICQELLQRTQPTIRQISDQNQKIFNDIDTLQSMKSDVCQSFDDIINQTTIQQFDTVLKAYNQTIEQIQSTIQIKESNNSFSQIEDMESSIGQQKVREVLRQIQKQFYSKKQPQTRISIKNNIRRMSLVGIR